MRDRRVVPVRSSHSRRRPGECLVYLPVPSVRRLTMESRLIFELVGRSRGAQAERRPQPPAPRAEIRDALVWLNAEHHRAGRRSPRFSPPVTATAGHCRGKRRQAVLKHSPECWLCDAVVVCVPVSRSSCCRLECIGKLSSQHAACPLHCRLVGSFLSLVYPPRSALARCPRSGAGDGDQGRGDANMSRLALTVAAR
jgi:hypothetical protein